MCVCVCVYKYKFNFIYSQYYLLDNFCLAALFELRVLFCCKSSMLYATIKLLVVI